MTLSEQLAALKALREKGTPGEWILEIEDGYCTGHVISPLHTYCGNIAVRKDSITAPDSMTYADGQLIVAAVNALPDILKLVEGLGELRERCIRQNNTFVPEGMKRAEYWRGFAAACGEKAKEIDALLHPLAPDIQPTEKEV